MYTDQERIDRFIARIDNHINSIAKLESDNYLYVFKKILYSVAIDAMSRSIFPHENNSRNRFVDFVKKFADWEFGNKISLPHIVRLLKKLPDPKYNDARNFVENALRNWERAKPISLEEDVSYDEMRKHWRVNKDEKLFDGISIESTTHFQLFFNSRNFLVHEMRAPNGNYDDFVIDPQDPFYIHIGKLDTSRRYMDEWELCYPVEFFHKLCMNSLSNLKIHLKSIGIDPSSFYTEGPYFIDKLNKA